MTDIPIFIWMALGAACLAAISSGIVGCLVVVRRMSALSGSLAHGVFGGIGLSYFFGWPIYLGAVGVSVVLAAFLALSRRITSVREEALMSVMWSVGMAVGILLIYLTKGYATDLFGYLFGNVLLVGPTQLWGLLALNIGVVAICMVFFRVFQAMSFDEDYTEILNVPVPMMTVVLYVVLGLTVVSLIRVVGVILCLALLSLPAMTAERWVQELRQMMGIAVVVGLVSVLAGFGVSYVLDVPTGPVIVLVSFGLYVLSVYATRRR